MVQYVDLFGVLRENALGAHDVTYAVYYEKSLCSDNDSDNLLRLDRAITKVINES